MMASNLMSPRVLAKSSVGLLTCANQLVQAMSISIKKALMCSFMAFHLSLPVFAAA